jgi:hypothetical protein
VFFVTLLIVQSKDHEGHEGRYKGHEEMVLYTMNELWELDLMPIISCMMNFINFLFRDIDE